MLKRKFVKFGLILFIVISTACSAAFILAPEMPANLNKPSTVTKTKINNIEVGLPKGWSSTKIPKSDPTLEIVMKLKHRDYGVMTVYKSPWLSDAHYGRIMTRKILFGVTPDAKQIGSKMEINSGAIVEIYKGSMAIGGERLNYNTYLAYKISNGVGSGSMYYIYFNSLDKLKNKKAFNDFIAIAGSL